MERVSEGRKNMNAHGFVFTESLLLLLAYKT